jgi:SMC interacting uncharacterized protein involved in chromosome segregation
MDNKFHKHFSIVFANVPPCPCAIHIYKWLYNIVDIDLFFVIKNI